MSSRTEPIPPCLFSGAVTGDYPPDLYRAFRALGEVLATAEVPDTLPEEPVEVSQQLKLEAVAATARELAESVRDEGVVEEYASDGEYRSAYISAGAHHARHVLEAFAAVAAVVLKAGDEEVGKWLVARGEEPLGSYQDLLRVLALAARHLAQVVRDGAETLRGAIAPEHLEEVMANDRDATVADWTLLLTDSLTAGLAVFIADAEGLAAGRPFAPDVEARQRTHREVDPKAYRREGGGQ